MPQQRGKLLLEVNKNINTPMMNDEYYCNGITRRYNMYLYKIDKEYDDE